MRVCYVSHYAELYGANRSLIDSIRYLKSHEIEPIVVFPRDGAAKKALDSIGVLTRVIPFDVDWYNPNHLKPSVLKFRRTKKRNLEKEAATKLIAQLAPDIIHSNSSVFLTGAYAAKSLGIPHIWHLREDMWSHYSRTYDSSSQAKRLFANTDVSISTSEYIAQVFKSRGYTSKRGIVLPNPIEHFKLDVKKTSKSLRFGVVGLFHKRKNQVFILQALIPLLNSYEMELHFIGSGSKELTREMNQIVHSNKLQDRVFFHGFMEDVDEIYSHFDVLINFSENEGFGRVNIEAFSRKIPVVGLNSGATPEIVKDQISGLIALKSEVSLRSAVTKFLLDPKLQNKLGENAYDSYSKIYTPENYVNELNALYLSSIQQ